MGMNYGQYNAYQPYNPLAPYQQQLANMQNQWNGMQQQQPMQQQEPQQSIICRPVASIEEARGVQTDFSGALMVFPDVSHGMIYTKRLDFTTGSAVFNTYKLDASPAQPIQENAAPAVEYAPMSEVTALKDKISELEAMLSEKSKPAPKGAAEK